MSHFIYVIGTVDDDGALVAPVKIGISGNPHIRILAIRTSCPNKIELAHFFQVREREAAQRLEKSAHDIWQDAALSGEWFDIDPSTAMQFIAMDIEEGIIEFAAKHRENGDFIRQKLEWTGVTSAKQKLAAERYLWVWGQQAA
jgi:hypothetical protein